MLWMAHVYSFEGEFGKLLKNAVRIIAASRTPYSHSKLLRNLNIDKDRMKLVIDTLSERKEIEKVFGRKQGVFYTIPGASKKAK